MLIMTTALPATFGPAMTRPRVGLPAMPFGVWQPDADSRRAVPAGARRLDVPSTHRDRAARFAAKQASPPREDQR